MDIKAFVKAPIYLSPKFVYLRGPAGRSLSRTVSLKAGEERPLKLEEGSFDLGSKVAYTIEEVEAGRFFSIRFTTIPGPPGDYRGVLTLKTNYPERPQIAIPVMVRLHGAVKPQEGKGK